jgi:signal transduction histidine kinase
MIKGMGGRLAVESREGVGTRFTVTLPVAEAASLLASRNPPDNQEVA